MLNGISSDPRVVDLERSRSGYPISKALNGISSDLPICRTSQYVDPSNRQRVIVNPGVICSQPPKTSNTLGKGSKGEAEVSGKPGRCSFKIVAQVTSLVLAPVSSASR